MAFPPAHILVGVGAAEVVLAGAPLPRWRAWMLAATLAVLPDMDFGLGLLRGNADASHGTFTHSITAVLGVALAVGVAAGGRWAAVSAVGWGSHLLVDLLDARGRTNVLLWWPWSREPAVGIAPLFPVVPFHQGGGVWVAFESLFLPEVFAKLLQQTLLGVAGFVLLVGVAWLLRAQRV